MEKPRVLITEENLFAVNNLTECLQNYFDVLTCVQPQSLLDMICKFEPDVLILDLSLPGGNAFELVNTIRASGNTVEIIALSRFRAGHLVRLLETLGIFQLVMKPYSNELIVSCVFSALQVRCEWDAELEIYSILGSLGFQLGTHRVRCVADGVLLWHRANGSVATKQLYLELAHLYDKTATGIEKTIRDAIHHAWNRGNRNLWAAYFPEQNTMRQRCPSNEVFIARMAQCLWTKQRIRLHYKKAE